MPRFFIKLAYNGTAYHGWQIQENAPTVQAELNEKISLLIGEKVNLVGCGRTDAGVHARLFFAHFDITEKTAKKIMITEFVHRLNGFLPKDIVVFSLIPVPYDYHARFSAVSRTYRYYISRKKAPFLQGLCFVYTGNIHLKNMQKAAGYLSEYDDFTSFSKLHTQTKTNLCTISQAQWHVEDDLLIFTISANRFLRNMVRAIVGTLLEIGQEKLHPEAIKTIIEAKERSKAGFSVPAQGLFLEKIDYPFFSNKTTFST